MSVYARDRAITFLTPVVGVTGPERVGDVVRQLRGIVFPEDKYNDIDYARKAKDVFERLRSVRMVTTPLQGQ